MVKGSIQRLFLMCLVFLIGWTSFSPQWTDNTAFAAVDRKNDPLNGDWSKPYEVKYDTAEADLMVRVGDIDNLGMGWPDGYDPFSGKSTPAPYPRVIHQSTDPQGTDQLMVISSFRYPSLAGARDADTIADGYTRSNTYSKGANPVVPVKITFDTRNTPIEGAILQMFINDYQPQKYPGRVKYTAELNGVRAPFLENIINSLNQHGPVGKLISVKIPDEYLPLLKDGSLSIVLDDKTTKDPYGDAGAIDFVKLLINLGQYQNTGTITGKVMDSSPTPKPLAGALVSAGGIVTTLTNERGEYTLSEVPAGLVSVEASKDGYIPQIKLIENFVAGSKARLDFQLELQPSNNAFLQNLTVKGDTLIPLVPGFDKLESSYEVQLNSHVPTVMLTPTLEDSRATMTVNGEAHESGTPKAIAVKPGTTKVTITVTAQDGKTTRTYEVTILTPLTSMELSRSLTKSAIKLGETSEIRYTVTPASFQAEGLAGKPADRATGIRPFFLLNGPFVYGKSYDMAAELDKVKASGKGNDNNGGLALDTRGKKSYREMLLSGYDGTVSVNQSLTTEPSAKQSDILAGLKELIQTGTREITIPLVDASQLVNDLHGRDSITVNAFATFGISLVNNRVIANFIGYGPLPESFTVTDVTLTEPFPPEVNIVSIDKNWSKTVANGVLTLNVPDITFTRNGDRYEAAPVTLGITVKPTRIGTYLLSESQFRYREGSVVNSRFFNNVTLQVDSNIPPVTSLTVSPKNATLTVGETIGLKVTITPSNADRSVVWTSSDPAVATVSSSGIVTGTKPGRAVITVHTPDGKFSATSEITVTSKPELSVSANQGWNVPYPEKAVITAEVIDYAAAFPVRVDIRIDGVSLPAAALTQSEPLSLGNGRQKVTYTFEIEAARKQSGTEIGEVLRVKPAVITVDARNDFGIPADPVRNTLLFNPVTAFTATLEREGPLVTSTGVLTATPTTPVLDEVKFFWLPDVPLKEVTVDSPWIPFNQGRKATGIPLNPVGTTTLVVGMFQDFNQDGDYRQPDGSPDEHEMVVRKVSIGQSLIPPDFTLKSGERLDDYVKVVVQPMPETIQVTTEWYYKTPSQRDWTEFSLRQNGQRIAGEFVVPFEKGAGGLVDTLVTVKAVTLINGVEDERAMTVKTLLLLPEKGNDGGGGGEVPEDFSPHVYIKVDNGHETLENRAVQVQLGYSFDGSEGLRLTSASYAIAEANKKLDLIGELKAGKGVSITNGQNRIVKNLKTTSGQSQTYKAAILVEIKMLHSITHEVLWTKEYKQEADVTVKAKNNLN
ncbi:cadherin-like beta sandwich domain-containing protein [Brevibacillus ruminantium]|uniref:Cadherin-like beta sandwich domain-containing protein n=1 Tax=Brevibacillus ruminantium TaxID=2950604 RepID=A0ABY4WBW8_9BACL|nr:cadherin-like beta sandwich domain-containing protein [Brevibacillus ruminantium]USG64677.1 cadherin-like beta sandwich domain-containing protein [Brevibacillus ruminantium]